MVDFSSLLEDHGDSLIDPREIFMTLTRDKRFPFPRDIQTEVMKAWFDVRTQDDTIIKLNVGSGKTLVGLLLLKSSINEKCGPALYVCPDKQLVSQVVEEAALLGLDVTEDPKDPSYEASEKICITTIHKLFNGKSVFGVGPEGVKIKIGTLMVDDAHACISTVSDQFRITIPNGHTVYSKIFELVSEDLRHQSSPQYLDLKAEDPHAAMEVPFWSWQTNTDAILKALHESKHDDELLFSYPLLSEVLTQCRCIIGGQRLEIEPICPPTDLVSAFSHAKRRIYMTATLSDDSVLVTHFGADPEKLKAPIVPFSSQSMGERMILLPQELNPDLNVADIKNLLMKLSKDINLVVLVPSTVAANSWKDEADQILMANNVVEGVEKLRNGHVGLTILVNRYDGIDLPDDACRVLAIVDLPEVSSYRELADMTVLASSDTILRRQMQRIEQGMGRGVRSNDDYCVVLLCGAGLTRRLKSADGQAMLTGATQAQLNLSTNLANQLSGSSLQGIEDVIRRSLDRDEEWVKVSKMALVKTQPDEGLTLDPVSVATRSSFDHAKYGDHVEAATILQRAIDVTDDSHLKAWLRVRLAEVTHPIDPVDAQKILLRAHKNSPSVLKPLEGVAYQKLSPSADEQAAKVQTYHKEKFLEAVDRILYTKELLEDLVFDPDKTSKFEAAIDDIARMMGFGSQRPEQLGDGPDNLWVFHGGAFLVIECKSGATSADGISKHDMGQLGQSMSWFRSKYTDAVPVTPVIIHPHKKLGPGAAIIDDMRVVTKPQLDTLKTALEAFNRSLGDVNIVNDLARIAHLLTTHAFTPTMFVSTYTIPVSSQLVSRRIQHTRSLQ